MCGRYSLTTPVEGIARLFAFDARPNLAARYNIAPTQPVPVLRDDLAGRRELALVRWGLVPSWAKDVAAGAPLINARAETVAQKPAFRSAFKRRRCLIPADGFYEWRAWPDGPKQPYRIAMADDTVFAFAGIWEHWEAEDGSVLQTCAIITTEANDWMVRIHDRQPVILPERFYSDWLDPQQSWDDVSEMLSPSLDGLELTEHVVTGEVNSSRNWGGPEFLEAVSPQ